MVDFLEFTAWVVGLIAASLIIVFVWGTVNYSLRKVFITRLFVSIIKNGQRIERLALARVGKSKDFSLGVWLVDNAANPQSTYRSLRLTAYELLIFDGALNHFNPLTIGGAMSDWDNRVSQLFWVDLHKTRSFKLPTLQLAAKRAAERIRCSVVKKVTDAWQLVIAPNLD
ncbi:MAG: hypothetical protein WCO55_06260 [Candidatus Falkowbacteria bacterium]